MSWRGLYPFQPRYLELPGGHKLHYIDEGSGEPVVFVHGNPWWSFCFRNLSEGVRPRRRAIAFDHIGMGLSSKPTDEEYRFTLQSRVDDMDRLMDALKLERVTLVVHDWGGMIGCAWACRRPERVARLIVFNTAAWLPEGCGFPWQLSLARSRLGGLLVRGLNLFMIGGLVTSFHRRLFSNDERDGYFFPSKEMRNRLAIHRFVQDIPRNPGDPAYDLCKWTGDNLHKLAEKPALIVWGGRDFVFTQPFFEEWKKRFPGAQAHLIETAGHLVFDDAREEAVDFVQDFLARHPLGAAR